MKIAYVLAYPIYHERGSLANTSEPSIAERWLRVENQNRWIPGVLTELGNEVEYWIGDTEGGDYRSHLSGFPDYPVRVFACDPVDRRTKYHQSHALVDYARRWRPDLVLIKGIDGGIGTHLIDTYLLPEQVPFVLVTGGKFYTQHVRDAALTIYETEYQRERLVQPGFPQRLWRSPVDPARLVPMPKSVDTDVFRPMPAVEPDYDIVVVGRLHRRQKSFDEAGRLSERFRVAVAGDGPEADRLKRRYPRVNWLGQIPNGEIPRFLNRGRLFLHPAAHDRRPTRDFFPRVIAEALACGVPAVGFDDLIQPDVLPDGCGLRVGRSDYMEPITALLGDEMRRVRYSENARAHAVAHLGKRSSEPALRTILDRLGGTVL